MDNYKNIGKKIKEERETLKLTQKELAKRAGIDFRFLGNIERGISKPSLDTIVKISRALDIPLDILVAEKVYWKNPPETSAITKEIVRLMSMLEDFDALRVLQIVRYSIELFTGHKVNIPNEIQSHLKDERTVANRDDEFFEEEDIDEEKEKKKAKKHKGCLSKFLEQGNQKGILLNPHKDDIEGIKKLEAFKLQQKKKKKLKPKRAKKQVWLL
jgi:transcriptional regulator with XRE-family HTH domain